MDNITDMWDDTASESVTSYTDKDLTYSRSWSTRVYDPTGEYRNKALAIQEEWNLENLSSTIDFATRVAIAKLIDDGEVQIERKQFGIKYTIPPHWWVKRKVRGSLSVPDYDYADEFIQASMPPVCKDMIEAIVENGLFENKKEVIQYGLDVLSTTKSRKGLKFDKNKPGDVIKDTYKEYEESGATLQVFDFISDHYLDRIVVRFDLEDDAPHQLKVFDHESEEPVEKMAFESREIEFPPVSVIGKHTNENMKGIEVTRDSYEDVPPIIEAVWKSLGFAVVPENSEWVA